MRKQAEDFAVETSGEGLIDIKQSSHEDVIRIHPEQVELLVDWLREASREIANAETKRRPA